MNDTKRKVIKLALVCAICIGLVAGLTILIRSIIS